MIELEVSQKDELESKKEENWLNSNSNSFLSSNNLDEIDDLQVIEG